MATNRPVQQQLTIAGPSGGLEAVLEEPSEGGVRAVAVICHPHPVHGGTMHNKVVHTLARAFGGLGLSTLRFNFRGVGDSEGSYAEGEGELKDAIAVIDWALARQPETALWMGGFSFGACVALRAVNQRPVARLVAVAPPVDRCPLEAPPRCPVLVIQGDNDELVDQPHMGAGNLDIGLGIVVDAAAPVDNSVRLRVDRSLYDRVRQRLP